MGKTKRPSIDLSAIPEYIGEKEMEKYVEQYVQENIDGKRCIICYPAMRANIAPSIDDREIQLWLMNALKTLHDDNIYTLIQGKAYSPIFSCNIGDEKKSIKKDMFSTTRLVLKIEKEKNKFLFKLVENIKTTMEGTESTKEIEYTIFEISDMKEIYDVFSGKSTYIFRNVVYFSGLRAINEPVVETDNIYNVINYFSSDAVRKLKDYDIAAKDIIVDVCRFICEGNRNDITSIWGLIGKGKMFFPPNYRLKSKIKTPMMSQYEKMFEVVERPQETAPIMEKLLQYVDGDYVGKIILQYALASIFRYYMLNEKKIDLFPNLIVIGEKGYGKSARINLLFNQFLMNTTDFYTKEVFGGTGIRLQHEGWNTMPMFIDEISEFPPRMYDVLKAVATAPSVSITKYNARQEAIVYTLLRPLIIATNRLKLTDAAFEDRCIIIGVSEKIEMSREKEETYRFLKDNIEKLGQVVYMLLPGIIEHIEGIGVDGNRSKCKKEIIRVGGEIMKYIVKNYGTLIADGTYAPAELIEEGRHTVGMKDLLDEHILKELKRIVQEVSKNRVSLATIMDYGESEKNPESDVAICISELEKYGLYFKYTKEGKHVVGIAGKGMTHLGLKKEFKINSMKMLAVEMETNVKTIRTIDGGVSPKCVVFELE